MLHLLAQLAASAIVHGVTVHELQRGSICIQTHARRVGHVVDDDTVFELESVSLSTEGATVVRSPTRDREPIENDWV